MLLLWAVQAALLELGQELALLLGELGHLVDRKDTGPGREVG